VGIILQARGVPVIFLDPHVRNHLGQIVKIEVLPPLDVLVDDVLESMSPVSPDKIDPFEIGVVPDAGNFSCPFPPEFRDSLLGSVGVLTVNRPMRSDFPFDRSLADVFLYALLYVPDGWNVIEFVSDPAEDVLSGAAEGEGAAGYASGDGTGEVIEDFGIEDAVGGKRASAGDAFVAEPLFGLFSGVA
jgi:hypothetical protein